MYGILFYLACLISLISCSCVSLVFLIISSCVCCLPARLSAPFLLYLTSPALFLYISALKLLLSLPPKMSTQSEIFYILLSEWRHLLFRRILQQLHVTFNEATAVMVSINGFDSESRTKRPMQQVYLCLHSLEQNGFGSHLISPKNIDK